MTFSVCARVCLCVKLGEGPLYKHVINLYISHWTSSSIILKPRSSVTSHFLTCGREKTNSLQLKWKDDSDISAAFRVDYSFCHSECNLGLSSNGNQPVTKNVVVDTKRRSQLDKIIKDRHRQWATILAAKCCCCCACETFIAPSSDYSCDIIGHRLFPPSNWRAFSLEMASWRIKYLQILVTTHNSDLLKF